MLGFDAIPVKYITGLTMIQGFFASLSAMLFHSKKRFVNKTLALTLGLSLFSSSFLGALFSKGSSDKSLLFIFGLLAFLALVLMLIPRSYQRDELTEDKVDFYKPTAILSGIFICFLLGMVGQGGAFIIIPILFYVLKIPLRVALGSTLAIGLFSATAGLIGKIATGQVPSMADEAPVGISTSRDGISLYANRACLRMFGYESSQEFIGTSQLNRVAPDYRWQMNLNIIKRRRGDAVPNQYEFMGQKRRIDVSRMDRCVKGSTG